MVDRCDYANLSENWKTGQDVFNWWISGKAVPKELENQISIKTLYDGETETG